METKRISLAQQIAQLEDTAPADFDPEDTQLRGIDSIDDISGNVSTRDHYLPVGPSALRRQQASLADPKYDGVRTTRAQLMQADAEGASYSEEDDQPEEQDSEEDDQCPAEPELEDETSNYVQEADEDEATASKVDSPRRSSSRQRDSEPPLQDPSSTLQKIRDNDHTKGRAISRQIAIWDTLLDARIRMQSAVSSANRLPAPTNISEFMAASECRESLNQMLEESLNLSEEIFSLQEYLLSSNESITPPPRKKRKTQSTDDEVFDYELEFQEATVAASALEHSFHNDLVQTLSKWSTKIQAVAPSVLIVSNRNSFSSKSRDLKTAVQLIDETLGDHKKVVARTQIRRGKASRIGSERNENEQNDDDNHHPDVEAFDDTDFYQQLLRDIIDTRGSGVGGNEDWTTIQKQRKLRKKVDTKASKGRKLRYEVHEKLQSFMVPVPMPGSWHEEQIDELFTSLLGKGFEVAYVDSAGMEQEQDKVEHDPDEALGGGFRVFG